MELELIRAERQLARAREQLGRLSLQYRQRRREIRRARIIEESTLEQELALLSLGRDVRAQQRAVKRAEEQYDRVLSKMRREEC